MRTSDVTPAHIRKFQTSVAAGETKTDVKTKLRGRAIVRGDKATAARTLGLLGGIFSYAVESGFLDRNPTHGVKRFPDKKNERFLSPVEIKLAGDILSQAKSDGINDKAIDIIRLLIFTGARRGEIQSLQWKEVDLERKMLLLDDSKAGQKIIRLSNPALAILTQRQSTAGKAEGYVFPASEGDGAYTATSRIWSKLRAGTALEDVRLHDMRHSFASLAIAQGTSLAIIGKLLGHANVSTTQRYAHLADDPLAAATEQVGEAIAEMFSFPKLT